MELYVNYSTGKLKLAEEGKTIGVILCQNKSNKAGSAGLRTTFNVLFVKLKAIASKKTTVF